MYGMNLDKLYGSYTLSNYLFDLIETLPDVYFFAKDKKSRLLYLNQANFSIFGVKTVEEYFGKDDYHFFPPTMANAYINEDQKVMNKGPILNRVWLVHNLSLRLPQWFVSSKVPVVTTDNEILGIAGAMYSINNSKLKAKYFKELMPVVKYIEENFAHHVMMDNLAELIPCSRTQLNRRFMSLLHMTPTEFLMAQRVQAARHLLANSSMEIIDIAHEVGFCDQSHLTRRFRLVTGETPAAFRKKFR